MIDVEIFKKKSSTNTGNGGGSVIGSMQSGYSSGEATHADRADEASHASEADHATTSTKADTAAAASTLDSSSPDWETIDEKDKAIGDAAKAYTDNKLTELETNNDKKYLRKDQNDETKHSLGVGGDLSVNGKTKTSNIENSGDIDNGGCITTDELKSKSYEASTDDDILSGKGLRFYDENGKTHLLTDFLTVRQKAYFSELDIRKISFIGGDNIMSAAGNTIVKVEGITDVNGKGYKCYFMADNGEDVVENLWKVGDQAMCRTFKPKTGTSTFISNRYYWRLVTSVGTEKVKVGTDDNNNDVMRTMGFVVLSDSDSNPTELTDTDGTKYTPWDAATNRTAQFYCKDTSVEQSIPQAGDTIVQLGSQTDSGRMKAIRLRVTKDNDEAAPAIVFYSGIDHFELPETFALSPDGITGELKLTNITIKNDAGEPISVSNWRGEYSDKDKYYKNDTVTFGGQMWSWMQSDPVSGKEPSVANGWTLVVAKGEQGGRGEQGPQGDAAVTYDVQAFKQSAVVTPPKYDTKTGKATDANSYINIDCSYTVDKITGTVRTDCTNEAKLRWKYDNATEWSGYTSNGILTISVKNGTYDNLPSEVYVEVNIGDTCIKSFTIPIVLEAQTYIRDIPGLFQRTVANAESYATIKQATDGISAKVENLSTRYRNMLVGTDLSDVSKIGGHLYTNNTDTIANTAEISTTEKHDGLNSVHVKTAAANYYVGAYFSPITIAHNSKYHVAVWAKGKGTLSIEYKYKSEATSDTSKRDGDVKGVATFALTDGWQLFEDDFTTDGAHDYMECNFWCNDADTECWLSGFMLGSGNVYTGWTPSVNDETAEGRISAEINVKADEISASVKEDIGGNLSKTGIDIKNHKINVTTQELNILGNNGNKYIYISVDDNGFPHLVFINPQTGEPAYDLGYNGLSQLIEYAQKAGFDTLGIFARSFNAGDTVTAEYLWNIVQTTSSGQMVRADNLYQFHAATTNGNDGKIIYTTPNGASLDGHVYQSDRLNTSYEPASLEAVNGIYISSKYSEDKTKNERTFEVYVVKDGTVDRFLALHYDYAEIVVQRISSGSSSESGVTSYSVWYKGHDDSKGTSLAIKAPVEK